MSSKLIFYIVKRVFLALFTILFVITITFFAMKAVPGGPFMSEKAVSAEVQAALEKKYGLDKPVFEQYTTYLKDIVTGFDFGPSIKQRGRDVTDIITDGMKTSIPLGLCAAGIALIFGVVLGGISGYFGGAVDGVIMRICDILMCLPGFPILLIIGTLLDSMGVPSQLRIYYLMAYLTLFSWPGTARLVRGQILSLREQEYMVAAEAMGYSTSRKIFKHLVPNVMPQLIVSMTLSLGSMILYRPPCPT